MIDLAYDLGTIVSYTPTDVSIVTGVSESVQEELSASLAAFLNETESTAVVVGGSRSKSASTVEPTLWKLFGVDPIAAATQKKSSRSAPKSTKSQKKAKLAKKKTMPKHAKTAMMSTFIHGGGPAPRFSDLPDAPAGLFASREVSEDSGDAPGDESYHSQSSESAASNDITSYFV